MSENLIIYLEEDEINLFIDTLKTMVKIMKQSTDKPEVIYKDIWSNTIKLLDKLEKRKEEKWLKLLKKVNSKAKYINGG